MLQVPFAAWLAALAAAGRGGLKAKDDIVRGEVWTTIIEVEADWSGDTLVASLGFEPDDGASETNDLSVNVGPFTGGKTQITLQLSSTSTALLAADTDGDGLEPILFDIHRTPSGGSKYLAFGGWTYITGSVGDV